MSTRNMILILNGNIDCLITNISDCAIYCEMRFNVKKLIALAGSLFLCMYTLSKNMPENHENSLNSLNKFNSFKENYVCGRLTIGLSVTCCKILD